LEVKIHNRAQLLILPHNWNPFPDTFRVGLEPLLVLVQRLAVLAEILISCELSPALYQKGVTSIQAALEGFELAQELLDHDESEAKRVPA